MMDDFAVKMNSVAVLLLSWAVARYGKNNEKVEGGVGYAKVK